MSLDTTSHLVTPRPDELVPSRYALRVGDIDVMVISDGVLPITSRHDGHQRRLCRPVGLAQGHVPAAGDNRLAVERGRGAQRRPDHPHRFRAGDRVPGLPAGRAVGHATGRRRDRSRIRDRRGAHPPAHGPHRRVARRRAEGPAAAGPAGPPGGRRGRVLGSARLLPHGHAGADSGRASADRRAVPGRVPQPVAAVRDGVRGGAWSDDLSAPAVTPPATASSAWSPAATG